MTAAFTFPGQGSQAVGMGKALAEAFPAARAVFDEVDAALGEKLTAIIWDGPAETLQLTENAQPALMAVSLAALRVLETEAGFSVGRDAAFVAGHSLGEYSALAAAGSLSIGDTARLLRTRGLAMQKAVPVGVGAMAALLGLDYEAAVAVAERSRAGAGLPGRQRQWRRPGRGVRRQGRGRARARNRQDQGRQARHAAAGVRAVPLPADAARGRRDGRRRWPSVTIKQPASPLVSNVLAAPITDPDEIRRRLVEQVTGTVRWRESVAYMASHGVTRFFEIGAGKVLSGLVKRIADGAVGDFGRRPRRYCRGKRRARCGAFGLSGREEMRMFDLTGRTALVTGATGGIGGAIAQALHAQGATVAISGTRREVLDTLAGKLGERVHVLPCNLSDTAEVEALVPAAEKAMGQVDILVANAGITRDNLFVQLRDEDWDEVIRVNLTATFRLARAATKLMMRKRFGRIIAITSVVGVTGNPGQGNYTASKAGLIGMIKTLGAEYAKRNITANCIAPGFIATPMTDALNDKQRETILSKVPAARLGTPEDIAAAAVYLSSNEAGYVTGQTIHVNGGMAMI